MNFKVIKAIKPLSPNRWVKGVKIVDGKLWSNGPIADVEGETHNTINFSRKMMIEIYDILKEDDTEIVFDSQDLPFLMSKERCINGMCCQDCKTCRFLGVWKNAF